VIPTHFLQSNSTRIPADSNSIGWAAGTFTEVGMGICLEKLWDAATRRAGHAGHAAPPGGAQEAREVRAEAVELTSLPAPAENAATRRAGLHPRDALPEEAHLERTREVRAFVHRLMRKRGLPALLEHHARDLELPVHERGLTAEDVRRLAEHVRKHAHGWVHRRPKTNVSTGIDPDVVNLYDVNINFLVPLAVIFGISFAELVSCGRPRRPPGVFLSHALHPVLQTCELLGQHAKDSELGADETVWICAAAL
jgi:hypothetical protein